MAIISSVRLKKVHTFGTTITLLDHRVNRFDRDAAAGYRAGTICDRICNFITICVLTGQQGISL